MQLALQPPVEPMEAKSVDQIPEGSDWQYEPKWDGFRCLLFKSGSEVYLQSKAEKPLSRYFPELTEAAGRLSADQFVLDGEITIPIDDTLSFEALLQRIHPAASRIGKLATETPAVFVAFDLLVAPRNTLLIDRPLSERRALLESFGEKHFDKVKSFRLSPCTRELARVRKWLNQVGSGLDGIVAKRVGSGYEPGERDQMQKIKNYRTADCVVAGFRYGSKQPLVGSLLLGLYEGGLLHHVGFTSGIPAEERRALTRKLEELIKPPGFTGRSPGGPSRWATERSGDWKPLAPRLVVEVSYDHFNEGRFRHGTRLLRWRPDKNPKQCRFDQVKQVKADLFALISERPSARRKAKSV
jgi:ATP-dependent DNA ligase